MEQADNLLLFGASGTGKTHIAAAIAHWMIEQGFRAKYISAINLVQQLQLAKKQLELVTAMTKLDKYRLIITANQPFSEWDNIFPDNMMTVAAIDRLIHHASIIEMSGESYRRVCRALFYLTTAVGS